MAERITYGVGAHEPIFHRLRTGNAVADEWRRWEYETSEENLDVLCELGVTHVHIACTKGFGLEYEKPLIERAARFAERAGRRGIRTSIYVQGFPVYYETFLLEVPAAEEWFARAQNGDHIPWGGQTFRRWIDPTREEFHEYQWRLLEYILGQFTPSAVGMDNTVPPPCWTESCRRSFRRYLREKFDGADLVRQFGIPSFDAVDLPRFDPVYYPPDAYRVVKDPLLQEWARWRSWVVSEFLRRTAELIHSLAPGTSFNSGAGCDGLRHNHLFAHGVDFEERLAVLDGVGMEESGWRPGAFERGGDANRRVVMDDRIGKGSQPAEAAAVRISTDSRWWKITAHYGKANGGGFWGEVDTLGKTIALCHNITFAQRATHLGTIGPLAASPRMFDDIAPVIAWCNRHIEVLTGRQRRVAPIAVWRGTSTLAFIRHRPVWEACAVEQMLYERHLPFTIFLDDALRRCLGEVKLLILPGTACVSDEQVALLTDYVRSGGSLLLLGPAGTRDERTRLRREYAFAHLFGKSMPGIEFFGPPHWVPELDFSAMPPRLSASFGEGKVALVRDIVPPVELDLTRDPYMPARQVMPKDILPPANESDILAELDALLGPTLRVEAPRWTLCEFWQRGEDLVVCCVNLHRRRDGGPVKLHLGPYQAQCVQLHTLLREQVDRLEVRAGGVEVDSLERFCAFVAEGVSRGRRVTGERPRTRTAGRCR